MTAQTEASDNGGYEPVSVTRHTSVTVSEPLSREVTAVTDVTDSQPRESAEPKAGPFARCSTAGCTRHTQTYLEDSALCVKCLDANLQAAVSLVRDELGGEVIKYGSEA